MLRVGRPPISWRKNPTGKIGKDAYAPIAFAIRDPQSKIENSHGGIAQLVERQLCKLEVRGSNPLASISISCGHEFSDFVPDRIHDDGSQKKKQKAITTRDRGMRME